MPGSDLSIDKRPTRLTPVDLDQWIKSFNTVVSSKKTKRFHFHMRWEAAQRIFRYQSTLWQVLGKSAGGYVIINGEKFLQEHDSLKLEKILGGMIRCNIFIEAKNGEEEG